MLNTKYHKIFDSDKNFTLFKTVKKEEVEKQLNQFGIKKLTVFDELGLDWDEWKCEQLTLAILPKNEFVDETANSTKTILHNNNLKNKKVYYSLDLTTQELANQNGLVKYFPERNLLVSLVNPFADKNVYDIVIQNITSLQPKTLSQDEILIRTVSHRFSQRITRQIRDKEANIRHTQDEQRLHTQRYKEALEHERQYKNELVGLKSFNTNHKEHICKELQELKNQKLIKKISLGEELTISFGDIYINGEVHDLEEKDGIKVPSKPVRKRVYIGELTFKLGDTITVKSNKPLNDKYEHPHAERGRICFGENQHKAEELLHSFQINKLAKLLYAWAFSYNDGDAYCSLQKFYDRERGQEE